MRTIFLLVCALMSATPDGWEESRAGRDAHLTIVRGDEIGPVVRALGAPTSERKLRLASDSGPVRSLEYVFADRRIQFDAEPALAAAGDDFVITVDAAGRIVDLLHEPNRFNFDQPRTMMASGHVVRAVTIVPGRGAWVRAGAD